MSHTIKVLDHGSVTLRNLAGPTRRTGMSIADVIGDTPLRDFDADDTDPANAARLSFAQLDSDVVTKADGTTDRKSVV